LLVKTPKGTAVQVQKKQTLYQILLRLYNSESQHRQPL